MKILFFISILNFSFFINAFKAQNIGINGTGNNAHLSALLDVDASPTNNMGFLMPRLTNVQRKAIAIPAIGLMVYDLTLKGIYIYDGIKWDCAQIPAGTVDHFANITAPNGFLECNGQAVNRTTYAELFSAIGALYGVGDGSTTFNVPDLRGEFIRGWDNGRGVDLGRVLGSGQTDDFKNHTHLSNVDTPDLNIASSQDGAGQSRQAPYARTPTKIGSTGGIETRPRNLSLMPCIKF